MTRPYPACAAARRRRGAVSRASNAGGSILEPKGVAISFMKVGSPVLDFLGTTDTVVLRIRSAALQVHHHDVVKHGRQGKCARRVVLSRRYQNNPLMTLAVARAYIHSCDDAGQV